MTAILVLPKFPGLSQTRPQSTRGFAHGGSACAPLIQPDGWANVRRKRGEAMRGNPVRAKLRKGGTAFGHMAFEFFTPGISQIMANAGCEFCIFDTEHSGAGIETIKQQVAYARGTSLVPMVRVPGSHYHLIAPMIDAGVMGIMVPMVETAEQAADIATWCRYRPQGVRGLAFGMAHDDYAGTDPIKAMRAANERTLVIALIETK